MSDLPPGTPVTVADEGSDRLIVAIDTTERARAERLANAVTPVCGLLKLGLEYFLSQGPAGVRAITGRPTFLDLKLYDIPNTVAGGVRAVLPLSPRMLTIHAAGGAEMIEAARRAAEEAGDERPLLLAVTVLTSLDSATLSEIGISGGVRQQVLRLAKLALNAGADGVVCSPHEVALLRSSLGKGPSLVVPGIRLPGTEAGDQTRVMGPREAVEAGADWIVVGRPITGTPDPAAAARAIAALLR